MYFFDINIFFWILTFFSNWNRIYLAWAIKMPFTFWVFVFLSQMPIFLSHLIQVSATPHKPNEIIQFFPQKRPRKNCQIQSILEEKQTKQTPFHLNRKILTQKSLKTMKHICFLFYLRAWGLSKDFLI